MTEETKVNRCVPCGGRYNECPVDDTGTDPNTGCILQPDGTTRCPEMDTCGIWSVNTDNVTCLTDSYITESLIISGANVNVHKLLGVYDQKSLVEVTGSGSAIASSYLSNFPPSNAFTKEVTEWRSAELGSDVVDSAYIGYDFGPIRLENGRLRYGIETYVKKDIGTIRIIQGCNKENRATKVRVERSEDGKKWFGVALLNVTDCDGLVTLNFNNSVPSRYWRIRPVAFNGGPEDYWAVKALEPSESQKPDVTNIQDKFWMENRDRKYQKKAITVKGSYTPPDRQSINSKWGMMFDLDAYYIEVPFRSVVQALGRPFVIGDIIELPSEAQYNVKMEKENLYLQITDTGWSSSSYSPTWQPTLLKITAKPALASEETQDIFGDMTRIMDNSGLMNIDNGNYGGKYQDYSDSTQSIKADANTMVPEAGIDYADVMKFSDEVIKWGDKVGKNMRPLDRNRSIYGIDALPPNGEEYTQGDEFPKKPKDGAYHRLTYTYLPGGNAIPARLHRFSTKKNMWIYLESDIRHQIDNLNPSIQEFNDPESSTRTPLYDIGKKKEGA